MECKRSLAEQQAILNTRNSSYVFNILQIISKIEAEFITRGCADVENPLTPMLNWYDMKLKQMIEYRPII